MRPTTQLGLLLHWACNAKRAHHAHYRMADVYQRRYRIVGVAVIAITLLSGSSLVADLHEVFQEAQRAVRLLTGLAVLLACALSATQTYLRFDMRSTDHRRSGASYAAVKRHLDQIITRAEDETVSDRVIDELRACLDELGRDSPQVADSVWSQAERVMPSLTFDDYQQERNDVQSP